MTKKSSYVLLIAFIGFLWVGCKKEPVQRTDEHKMIQTSNINDPTHAGWKHTSEQASPSVRQALSQARVNYTPGTHIERGPINNVEVNKKLGNTAVAVHEKNAKINGQYVELHYCQNDKGQIIGLKTKFGIDNTAGTKRAYGTGSEYTKLNGEYYNPAHPYPNRGKATSLGFYNRLSARFAEHGVYHDGTKWAVRRALNNGVTINADGTYMFVPRHYGDTRPNTSGSHYMYPHAGASSNNGAGGASGNNGTGGTGHQSGNSGASNHNNNGDNPPSYNDLFPDN